VKEIISRWLRFSGRSVPLEAPASQKIGMEGCYFTGVCDMAEIVLELLPGPLGAEVTRSEARKVVDRCKEIFEGLVARHAASSKTKPS
jgi:hypothetical protein